MLGSAVAAPSRWSGDLPALANLPAVANHAKAAWDVWNVRCEGNRDGLRPVQYLRRDRSARSVPAGQAALASPSGMCCHRWCMAACCSTRAVVTYTGVGTP